MIRKIRRWMKPLRSTILHPQWLATSASETRALLASVGESDRVLDVGCADAWPKSFLPDTVDYVGLDYLPTASEWYGTRPDAYGDAARIPFLDGTFDAVFLFDVLEHLPRPAQALEEVFRVLRPGGLLLMNTPFMYPLHDEPRDFRRWTRYGHEQLAEETGFQVQTLQAAGSPVRTGFLLANLALTKMALNGVARRRPAAVLLVLLPVLVPLFNLVAWLLARLEPADDMMPLSYRGVWTKPPAE